MKKLKLKALNFSSMEVLSRTQLKHVLGGGDGGSGSGSGTGSGSGSATGPGGCPVGTSPCTCGGQTGCASKYDCCVACGIDPKYC